jgi:hypothetical protein
MALFSFDYYNQNEIPSITLANPDGTPLYNLGTIYERSFSLRYNTLSEFTFTAPNRIGNDYTDYYDWLQYRRLVLVEGIGTFMITAISIENDGLLEVKKVTCQSLEFSLTGKKITLLQGSYTFYDPENANPAAPSLLTELLGYIPGWTLGEIDASLMYTIRYFEVTDKTLYDFLTNEISQTFQCVFVFDSINKKISAYTISNATTATDVFISFDNLMKSFTLNAVNEELVTALNVIGGENLDISLVNPIGGNTIYNFDYFKNTDWMTQDLIDALDAWETKINYYVSSYGGLLTDLFDANSAMLDMEAELATMQNELTALYTAKNAAIAGKFPSSEIAAIDTAIASKQGAITSKQTDIANQQVVINNLESQIEYINSQLAFSNNFTENQLALLDNFVIGNTYTNVNFIQTTLMTSTEIQKQAQELYDNGLLVLSRVSQPRYTFEIDSTNFLFLKEYQPFIEQISLGCTITVELKENYTVVPVLLGIDFSYDEPESFKLILSNRVRLDDQEFQYTDLFGSLVDSGTTTNFNSQKWNSTSRSYSTLSSGTNSVVLSSTKSTPDDLVIYGDTTGAVIKDTGGRYVVPTAFTPVVLCGDDVFTYDYAVGYYSIIGRNIFFQLSVGIGGISGTSTEAVYVQLPSYAKSVSSLSSVFPVAQSGITTSASSTVVGVLNPATANISLQKAASAQILNPIIGTALSPTTTTISISGSYFID